MISCVRVLSFTKERFPQHIICYNMLFCCRLMAFLSHFPLETDDVEEDGGFMDDVPGELDSGHHTLRATDVDSQVVENQALSPDQYGAYMVEPQESCVSQFSELSLHEQSTRTRDYRENYIERIGVDKKENVSSDGVQSQKAVSAYFTSKQILPLGFAQQSDAQGVSNFHSLRSEVFDMQVSTTDNSDEEGVLTDGREISFETDTDGDTCVHMAVIHGDMPCLRNIVQTTPPDSLHMLMNCQNKLQQTAGHLAIACREHAMLRVLLNHGSQPQLTDRHGNTLLHIACGQGDLVSLSFLLEKHPSDAVNSSLTHYGGASADSAITCKSSCVSSYINNRNFDGDTALHVAVKHGHVDLVCALLDMHPCGLDINAADGKSGRTVLHLAAETGNLNLVLQLVAHRESCHLLLDICTYSGDTAFQLALGRGHVEVAKRLLLSGAKLSTAS